MRRFATAIVQRRMALPAVLFLESMRPMNFVGSQALHFFNPVLGTVFNFKELEQLAMFLEKRESIPALVADIELLEDERERAQALERAARPRRRFWPFGQKAK